MLLGAEKLNKNAKTDFYLSCTVWAQIGNNRHSAWATGHEPDPP